MNTDSFDDILARMEAQERCSCQAWQQGWFALAAAYPALVRPVERAIVRGSPRNGKVWTPAEFGALVRGVMQELGGGYGGGDPA